MDIKSAFDCFNFKKQCEKYGVGIWQCPQFLFLVMGVIIIFAIIITNGVAQKYAEPSVVALIVLAVAAVLFVISFIIVSSFERVVQASLAKSEFIRIMSHQLRTPLSAIKWQIELLFNKKINPDQETVNRALLEIKDKNEKMIWVANNLLDVNLIEDKNLALSSSIFSLKDIVSEVVDMLNESAVRANLQIFVTSPQEIPNVSADKMRIKNIVYHFIDNAIRYSTGKGIVAVALESLPTGQAGLQGSVRFLVTDEGVGISKEDSKNIFKKLFRSQNTLTGQTSGSGVGLFIAKVIVERSGGKIGFTSAEGKGSTFWFTLPASV